MTREVFAGLVFHCRALGLPEPVAEFRFHPVREWMFDAAWPDHRIALEQEGVVYAKEQGDHRLGGRHTSRAGFVGDLEKYSEAFKLGWRLLRCLPSQVTDGQALTAVAIVLRGVNYEAELQEQAARYASALGVDLATRDGARQVAKAFAPRGGRRRQGGRKGGRGLRR